MLRFDGKAEIIGFVDTPVSRTRSQRVVNNGPAIIGCVLDAFKLVFPGCCDVSTSAILAWLQRAAGTHRL